MPTWYAIENKADATNEVEVSIYDEIGSWGVGANKFVSDLKKIDAKKINLRLNTPGGEVFDGTAIFNALRDHPADIVVHIDGLAASAGSFIAMSGDEIRMADNAYMMIHNGRGGVMGEAKDMRAYADVLEKINNNIAQMYADRTGKTKEHFSELMNAETWFTAEEALAQGLIDTITKNAAEPKKNATASFDFKIYNKAPQDAIERWGKPAQSSGIITQLTVTQTPVATSGDVAPPVLTKENTPMGENLTTTAPAQTPAAAVSNPSQGDVASFNAQAIQSYIDKGRTLGRAEGAQAELERFKGVVSACPDRPDMAINAFMTGQNAESVRLAYDAANATAAKFRTEQLESQREIARLQAIVATGGHPGVQLSPTLEPLQSSAGANPDIDPEQQAKMEWDSNPMIRAQHKEKDYVLFRTQQLKGNVRAFKKSI